MRRIAEMDDAEELEARRAGSGLNKHAVMNYEYADEESVDSFDSDFKNTDLGVVNIDEKQMGEYLPKLRKRQELTIVPEEIVMKIARAPNERMETIAGNLGAELPGRNDEEDMFELLFLLGLSKPDLDGTAIFKKHRLVPEKMLRLHIHAAHRLDYFRTLNVPFKDYSQKYWKKHPKDRVMQLYT